MKNILPLCVALLVGGSTDAQVPKGKNLVGISTGDHFGYAIAMPNEKTVAVGAPSHDKAGVNAGQVIVYNYHVDGWTKIGWEIDGLAPSDSFGFSISMPKGSPSKMAVGAIGSDANGNNAGQVRVFGWDGKQWNTMGKEINGENAGDQFGYSLSMPHFSTFAAGAPGSNNSTGSVRVFSWNGSQWVQKGSTILGVNPGDRMGNSVSMPDAQTIAVGAPGYGKSKAYEGLVRVYAWDGMDWVQKGNDHRGGGGDRMGSSVCMPTSNYLAIGATGNDYKGPETGYVRIYYWDSIYWKHFSNETIYGERSGDKFGLSIAIPYTGTMAVGGLDSATESGYVKVYKHSGFYWRELGAKIVGLGIGDRAGTSIAMPDNYNVAIGAPYNDDNGSNAGHVRVYSLPATGLEFASTNAVNIYPNPGNGQFILEHELGSNIHYQVMDLNGRVLKTGLIESPIMQLDLAKHPSGTYTLEISKSGHLIHTKQFIKD